VFTDEIANIQNQIFKLVFRMLQGWLQQLMEGQLNPNQIMGFMRSMGFDPSQLGGMVSQQPGFDPYQVLGLDKSARQEEVKQRYRELIFKLHPDKSGSSSTNFLFQMVLAAYEIINRERGWQ